MLVRVSDDGAGVTGGHPERVFAAHERGATAGPGAGLGLAIARGIVAAHGGTIGLESSTSGTTVVVALPVEPTGAPDPVPDRVPHRVPGQSPMVTQERP